MGIIITYQLVIYSTVAKELTTPLIYNINRFLFCFKGHCCYPFVVFIVHANTAVLYFVSNELIKICIKHLQIVIHTGIRLYF